MRWSAIATHTGDLFWTLPTQKKVNRLGMTISCVSSGQVVELWDVWDRARLMQQLGSSA